jgi:hypothetical protein
MANLVVPFSLSPALVNPGQLIDYSTSAGAKVYTASIKPLSESMYLLDSDGLGNFLLMSFSMGSHGSNKKRASSAIASRM